MLRLHVKRVVHTHTFNGQPNGESVDWVLFEEGEYSQPLAILSDFDVVRLMEEIHEQQAVAKDWRASGARNKPVVRSAGKQTTT